MALLPLALAGMAASILFVLLRAFKRRNRLPLPPGPKGLPIVGNINDMPPKGVVEAVHWLKHKDVYGPISSVTVLGQTIVFLNDLATVNELFVSRSATTSSRAVQEFSGEMLGWSRSLGGCPYGPRFRTLRKHTTRLIGTKAAAAQFNGNTEEEVAHFGLHLLENPDRVIKHIRNMAGSLILRMSYGYTTESHKDDFLIGVAEEAMDNFSVAAMPGNFLVDNLPWLKYVPDFFPGTEWKKTARKWREGLDRHADIPYNFVKHQMAAGVHEPSFLSKLIEAGDKPGEEAFANKWAAQSLYAAGTDTSVAAMECFFLAMMVFPEVQKKAQEEIDRVVGNKRVPNLADRENLPYIEGIMKEALRWNPVAPLGLPHASTQDEIIHGCVVPKGALLFPNVWWFTHDPESYPEPMEFKPERYQQTPPPPDPSTYAFGFGRRVCPGRPLAENSIWLTIAQTLATFNITKPVVNGKVVEPKVEFLPGIVSHPEPFKTDIKPRSAHHEELIKSLERTYPWRPSDSAVLGNIRKETV